MSYDQPFLNAFNFAMTHEGTTLDLNPKDSGNWTGGAGGRGELKGSHYGISAASYPHEDIANLTEDRAKAIYFTDFWMLYHIYQLPAPLSAKVFDATINMGFHAIVCLQRAFRAAGMGALPEDGVIGPATVKAASGASALALLAAYRAELAGYYRLDAAAHLSLAGELGGWLNRAYA